jgi:hypothetical protein
VFISVVSTNPATLLGFGTWAAFGAGRVLVGRDSNDTDFDTVEETGGAKTKAISAHSGTAVGTSGGGSAHTHTGPSHTHTYSQVPNHVHVENINTATTGGAVGFPALKDTSTSGSEATGLSTANPTGGVAQGTSDAGGTGNTGSESAHTHAAGTVTQPSGHTDLNVVQPYVVVYMWKRTA